VLVYSSRGWTLLSFTDALHFLSKVRSTMLNSRRSQPTPSDFQHALSKFDCPLLSLKPHLKPPAPKDETLIQMEVMTEEVDQTYSTIKLLGDELSGESDRRLMTHIPTGFPAFPSKHTYKWTEKEPSRETDPRKIREEAAKSAKSAEEALRKFVNVSKAGKEKDVKKNASKDPRSKQRHDLWESTMQKFMAGKPRLGQAEQTQRGEDDRSMVVNSERRYMRKGATSKRKPQPVGDSGQL
jgi:transcription initiation factor TFIID subunit 8